MSGSDGFSRTCAPGRPRGTVRQALVSGAWALAGEQSEGFTWRELALRTQVGFSAARQAAKDMARAGELRAVGTVPVAHARRPMTLYAPAAANCAGDRARALDALMRTWPR